MDELLTGLGFTRITDGYWLRVTPLTHLVVSRNVGPWAVWIFTGINALVEEHDSIHLYGTADDSQTLERLIHSAATMQMGGWVAPEPTEGIRVGDAYP